jgi:hypothetical protein
MHPRHQENRPAHHAAHGVEQQQRQGLDREGEERGGAVRLHPTPPTSVTTSAAATPGNGQALPAVRVATPGCRIGYMDHTGCHQLNRDLTAK